MGCRRPAPRSVLARFVLAEVEGGPQVVPDPGARLPGRGAWLHRDPGCAGLAVRRKAFARALRATGPVGTDLVTATARTWAVEQVRTEHDDKGRPRPAPRDRKRVDE
ncbi:YlxR family protein [Aquipuribacter nitratireducens]|uniref:YlxR family protein n=1 Tax=Aquipuribacter nitratireducens TaxID=650104 RepID=A0ABW0GL47_9MICO